MWAASVLPGGRGSQLCRPAAARACHRAASVLRGGRGSQRHPVRGHGRRADGQRPSSGADDDRNTLPSGGNPEIGELQLPSSGRTRIATPSARSPCLSPREQRPSSVRTRAQDAALDLIEKSDFALLYSVLIGSRPRRPADHRRHRHGHAAARQRRGRSSSPARTSRCRARHDDPTPRAHAFRLRSFATVRPC